MAEAQKQGKNKSKKAGKDKVKGAAYRNSHLREMHKVKRVLRSSGVEAAKKYAATRNVMGYLLAMPLYKRLTTDSRRMSGHRHADQAWSQA